MTTLGEELVLGLKPLFGLGLGLGLDLILNA